MSEGQNNPLAWAHPLVEEWFASRFTTPTEPQAQGWPHILARRHTLVSAPTGSGKTLAAFLACIDRLVRKALSGELANRTEVLYVSPLKALSNDIQKNLELPLREITEVAGQRGLLLPPIRIAVRTGDTLMPERRAMLLRPPHILVTTPESLYILLTAAKSRAILKDVETVIVDEIHAVADDKRGAHLALSLERLEALTAQHRAPGSLARIGLSATQKPLAVMGQFLTGSSRPEASIVDIGHRRAMDVSVEVPPSELGPVASNEMWDEVYDRITELVRQHRSTLVFVNTRRLAERLSHALSARLGQDAVCAHHGSLARKLRLAAENKLKSGEIRVLVATASLELGIDIGTVDLVCQISSPRAIAPALQRIGRAGHWRGAVPKGRIFAMTRDELIECAALVRAIRLGDLDQLQIPDAPMDVLAQQIVAECAAEEWNEDHLFQLVRRAYPYRDLPRSEFDELITMLSEGISARRGQYAAHLHRDRVNGRVHGRRGSRLTAITNGGAIPDSGLYAVRAEPEGLVVGTVDEDFAMESNRGDIILLGNSSWRIRRVESATGRMLVEDAHGAPPTVPFWRGEAPARTAELSAHVSDLRERIGDFLPQPTSWAAAQSNPQYAAAIAWLRTECGLNDSGAQQAIQYVLAGRAMLGVVPSQTTVVAERFFDEGGGMQLVIHAPFGGRINKAWGLALRKRFCRSFNFELQAAATEDGLNISLGEQHSFPLADVFHFLDPASVQGILEQAALPSPIFGTRWRWDASRALALPRFRNGRKIPIQIQRMLSDDLLAVVFPQALACPENVPGDIEIPSHPLVREVMKDVLTEALDLAGLQRVLQGIRAGSIRCVAVDTPTPSQFSHEILNANPYAYLDDAPLEERRARAVSMRRSLPEAMLTEIGRLDPAAIAQVRDEAWPDVRDADELHDVLEAVLALPEDFVAPDGRSVREAWSEYFAALCSQHRVTRATQDRRVLWIAATRIASFSALFPGAQFEPPCALLESPTPSRDDAAVAAVRGWLNCSGPLTTQALAGITGLPPADIDKALLRIEAEGAVLRGQYTQTGQLEWCDRRRLARIHRLTLGALRQEVKPVSAAQFMAWLLRWQHVAPSTQVLGERGLLEVLRQLQGFEAPANAWEPQILARRVAAYDREHLDRLCLTGAVGWGRLSPHPATLELSGAASIASPAPPAKVRRVTPSSVAPITFFVRDDAEWMVPQRGPSAEPPRGLSHAARGILEFLRMRGASFFPDIVRGAARLKSEVETGLWELVAAGLVTADGFDNLRSLIDPKRRSGHGHGRVARPRHSAGRWSVLFPGEPADRSRAAQAACGILLRRYGVVFRELLAREALGFQWRELLIEFRRLEDRGEIRGGRFVDGFLGEQFALPAAVESLRAMRRTEPTGALTVVSAADPLNLVGIVVPGEKVPANSGRPVPFRDGVAAPEPPDLVAAAGF